MQTIDDYKGREYTENLLKMWKCLRKHTGCLFIGVLDTVNSVILSNMVDIVLNKIKNSAIQSHYLHCESFLATYG